MAGHTPFAIVIGDCEIISRPLATDWNIIWQRGQAVILQMSYAEEECRYSDKWKELQKLVTVRGRESASYKRSRGINAPVERLYS